MRLSQKKDPIYIDNTQTKKIIYALYLIILLIKIHIVSQGLLPHAYCHEYSVSTIFLIEKKLINCFIYKTDE